MSRPLTVYLLVENNEVELPLCVADTLEEMADLIGVKKRSLMKWLDVEPYPGAKAKLISVEIDLDEEN